MASPWAVRTTLKHTFTLTPKWIPLNIPTYTHLLLEQFVAQIRCDYELLMKLAGGRETIRISVGESVRHKMGNTKVELTWGLSVSRLLPTSTQSQPNCGLKHGAMFSEFRAQFWLADLQQVPESLARLQLLPWLTLCNRILVGDSDMWMCGYFQTQLISCNWLSQWELKESQNNKKPLGCCIEQTRVAFHH